MTFEELTILKMRFSAKDDTDLIVALAARVAELEAAHQQIMGVCDPNTVPYQIARKALKG